MKAFIVRGSLALMLLPSMPALCGTGIVSLSAPDAGGGVISLESRTLPPRFYERYRPRTALDMVSNTPGFSMQSGSSARGLDGALGNVLINGARPPAKTGSAAELLAAIPAEDVEMIVLLPAGTTDVDMGGHAELLNVISITRTGVEGSTAFSGQDNGGGGHSGSAKADLRLVRPRRLLSLNAQATGAVTKTEGRLLAPLLGQVAARRSGGVQSESSSEKLGANGRWEPAGGGDVQFRVSASQARGNSRPVTQSRAGAVLQSSGASTSRAGDIGAEVQLPLGSSPMTLSLSTLLSQSESESLSRIRTASESRESHTASQKGESALRAAFRWKIADIWTLQTGFDYAKNYLHGDMGYRVDGVKTAIAGSSSRVSEARGGLFSALTWQPSPLWTWDAALRLEKSVLETDKNQAAHAKYNNVLPSLSTAWQPTPTIRLGAGLEHQVGQLAFSQFLARVNLDDQVLTAGSKTLFPEKSWRHSFDYQHRLGELGMFNLQLSRKETENPIDMVVANDGLQVLANVEPATIDSIDLRLSAPLDGFGLAGGMLHFNKTESWSRTTDPVTGEQREVSAAPAGAALALRQDLPSARGAWGISLSEGAQSTHYGVRQITRTGSHAAASVFGQWRPTDSLLVRLSYRSGRKSSSTSWLYAEQRRAESEASMVFAETSTSPSGWGMHLDWEPEPSCQLQLGMSTGGVTRYVSTSSSDSHAVVEHSSSRGYPAISANAQWRW